MIVPEQVYSQPLLKDQFTQQIEIVEREVVASIYGPQVLFAVPGDRVLILTNLTLSANDAPPIIARVYHTNTAAGQKRGVFDWQGSGAAGQPQSFNWQGQVWISPGRIMMGQVVPITATGVVTLSLHGVTIPRGSAAVG